MKKILSFCISIVLALSFAAPVFAEANPAQALQAKTPQQVHASAIKQANDEYKAALKKADADYKAAMAAASTLLKKVRQDALAAMKAAKQAADSALKSAIQANKKVTLGIGKNEALGSFLVGANGMTLYSKNEDTADKSTCYGTCASNWHPLTIGGKVSVAENVSGKVGSLKRTGGAMQVTYNGKPLYFWKGDTKVGDTTGNGFNGIWSVVKP